MNATLAKSAGHVKAAPRNLPRLASMRLLASKKQTSDLTSLSLALYPGARSYVDLQGACSNVVHTDTCCSYA